MYAPMDQALRFSEHPMVALLLRAGCRTQELQGHTFWRDDRSKSFFHALCSDTTLENVRLYLLCGYEVLDSEMSSRKMVCRLMRHHANEQRLLDLLREFSETPRSLMCSCRRVLRRSLMVRRRWRHTPMDAMISSLPLPRMLQDFLSLTSPLPQGQEAAGQGSTNGSD